MLAQMPSTSCRISLIVWVPVSPRSRVPTRWSLAMRRRTLSRATRQSFQVVQIMMSGYISQLSPYTPALMTSCGILSLETRTGYQCNGRLAGQEARLASMTCALSSSPSVSLNDSSSVSLKSITFGGEEAASARRSANSTEMRSNKVAGFRGTSTRSSPHIPEAVSIEDEKWSARKTCSRLVYGVLPICKRLTMLFLTPISTLLESSVI